MTKACVLADEARKKCVVTEMDFINAKINKKPGSRLYRSIEPRVCTNRNIGREQRSATPLAHAGLNLVKPKAN